MNELTYKEKYKLEKELAYIEDTAGLLPDGVFKRNILRSVKSARKFVSSEDCENDDMIDIVVHGAFSADPDDERGWDARGWDGMNTDDYTGACLMGNYCRRPFTIHAKVPAPKKFDPFVTKGRVDSK